MLRITTVSHFFFGAFLLTYSLAFAQDACPVNSIVKFDDMTFSGSETVSTCLFPSKMWRFGALRFKTCQPPHRL